MGIGGYRYVAAVARARAVFNATVGTPVDSEGRALPRPQVRVAPDPPTLTQRPCSPTRALARPRAPLHFR